MSEYNTITQPLVAGLNPEQAQAVVHASGCLAVVAGAGSGKTSVLTRRIAWLNQECGLPPDTIMAVTFTNKAASEMRARLEKLGIHGLSRMWLGTFHGLGARFLREYADAAGLRPRFNILDASDAERLFKGLAAQHGWVEKGLDVKETIGWIAARKDEGKAPEDITPRDSQESLFLLAYRTYQAECDRKGVVDFGELLLRPTKLLQANSAIREQFISRFSHILVDEFQDTNEVQYTWVDLLSRTGKRADVTVVGDMDQSIYSWRGAQMANLPRFVNEYRAQIIKLERNYRSTGHILAAANAVVSNNRQRIPKKLWTDQPAGHAVRFSIFDDGRAEAEWVARSLAASHGARQGTKWSDFAVLYRVGALSRQLEDAMIRHRVPYKVHGGLRFFDRMEIKDALSHLRLLADTADESALERALSSPPRGLGPSIIDPARTRAMREQISLHEAMTKEASSWGPRASRSWAEWETSRQAAALRTSLEDMVKWAVEETGLMERAIKQDAKDNTDRAGNLGELVSVAAEFDKQEAQLPIEERLLAFLDSAVLSPETEASSPDVVKLMTIHAAKGLEFPCVFLVGCDEKIFPSAMATDPERMEEERRLAYVAITRAERRLCMSSVKERMIYGKVQDMLPSRFLREVPAEHVEWDPSSITRQLDGRQSIARASGGSVRPNYNHRQSSPTSSGSVPGNWRAGEMVVHSVFGRGKIVRVVAGSPEPRLVVKFGNAERTLLPSIAKLRKG